MISFKINLSYFDHQYAHIPPKNIDSSLYRKSYMQVQEYELDIIFQKLYLFLTQILTKDNFYNSIIFFITMKKLKKIFFFVYIQKLS
jgi:hypothetical protein